MSEDISKKLTEEFETAAEQQVKSVIELSFSELVERPAKEINQLPENIFKQYFLPFFCGEVNTNKQNFLVQWISIAGTPIKEVEIIDENGNKLFNVPAIMDSTIIDVKNTKEGQSFFDITVNYELHRKQLPVIGETYLRNSLDERFKTLTTNSSSHEINERQWNEIFIRYGKIKDPAIEEVKKEDRLSDDEFIYD